MAFGRGLPIRRERDGSYSVQLSEPEQMPTLGPSIRRIATTLLEVLSCVPPWISCVTDALGSPERIAVEPRSRSHAAATIH